MKWTIRGLSSPSSIATHITSWSVARLTLAQEKPDTLVGQDTLLHGESLLVVSSSDPHDVALELVAEGVGLELLAHPLLVKGSHLKHKHNS